MLLKKLIIWVAGFYIPLLLFSCNNSAVQTNKSHSDVSAESIEKGKKLAAQYCQSCHMLPAPSLANAKTWENGILPQMGPRLGIVNFKGKTNPSYSRDINLPKGYYPSQPLLTNEEWQNIIDYYTATAPDTIVFPEFSQPQIKMQLPLFEVQKPHINYNTPTVSFVKIDSANKAMPVIISDALKQKIYRFNAALKPVDSVYSKGPVVDLEKQQNNWIACNIGLLNPNNEKRGSCYNISLHNQKFVLDSLPLFKDIVRPVQITETDLNNDGRKDYLVCEFGFLIGSLSWMENKGNGNFLRHVIRDLPGAIKVYIQDYNNDGLPDIWALFAQGEEGIFLFTNKGNGEFSQQEVLRFPPINGSSYFELDDFNNDGHPDILYTCGDNADYSTVLKPFHGVYIFMNDGNNKFVQKYFYHINGCYKAMAKDFDKDGDLDIATIAYFADYSQKPEEGFIYLENKAPNEFEPYTLPDFEVGRWLTMDVGDFDGNGFPDIILGNFSVAPSFTKSKVDWRNSPPFILLKNNGGHF